ncbi:hypothetical protein [Saccharothrix luteola]|uniref:hypothetical protein n=1 Tax=Saccharothrix luteola TaxID=2893018 RepID=UPI001E507A45|nr:hypothetical protein [Saccharothrix luteola]MCC8248109.1 hypothetical protein [Saccharothrix luteola]
MSSRRSGADRFGHDGTQPPPPPPLFPDPLAGLVTGERYVAEAVPPVVPPPPAPVSQPGPAHVPPNRRAPARKPVRAPAQQVSGEPVAHLPHAGLTPHQPRQGVAGPSSEPQGPKKSKGGLIGCLVVLAALSGLLFNVVREIIEAVVDLVR